MFLEKNLDLLPVSFSDVLGKIDVVCVSKTLPSKEWEKNLDLLPVHNLIVETSKPLAEARAKAIRKVGTPWFLFIDDDVLLCPDWFNLAVSHITDKVAAVQGREWIYGIGDKWENEINAFRWDKPNRALLPGDRGTTVNTLLRTDVVADWKPPAVKLSAYEDYLLTQHVLSKGFSWLDVKLPSWHLRRWLKVFTAARRDMRAFVKITDSRQQIKKAIKLFGAAALWSLEATYTPRNRRLRAYMVYQDLGCLVGMVLG
jgi:hypothetical protein